MNTQRQENNQPIRSPDWTLKKSFKKRKKMFPIKPGGRSRLSRLSHDWPIPETAQQNKYSSADVTLLWPITITILCFCHHHHRGDSLKERYHWLVLTFSEKVLKSRSADRDAPLVISHNASLCMGGV